MVPLPSPHLKTCLEDVLGVLPLPSPLANIHPSPSPPRYLPRSAIREKGQKGLQIRRPFPSPHSCDLTLGTCIRGPISPAGRKSEAAPALHTGTMQAGPPWPLASCPRGCALPAWGSLCCHFPGRGCSAGLTFLLAPGLHRLLPAPLPPPWGWLQRTGLADDTTCCVCPVHVSGNVSVVLLVDASLPLGEAGALGTWRGALSSKRAPPPPI